MAMVTQQEGQWVVPNPRVPRTFGILNIVFGGLLLLYAAYVIVMTVVGPRFQDAMLTQMRQQQATKKAERDAKIADLKTKEEAAKTEEEKKSLAEERDALEKSVEPDVSAIMTDAMGLARDKRMLAISYTSEITGAILNVLMVISGVALLRLSDWGRRLALGVAWLKILRWVVLTVVTLVVIVPITSEMTQKMFQEIEKQTKAKGAGQTAFPLTSLSQVTAVATAVSSVMSALFASIYPVLSLWFLTRPATRAACLTRAKPSGAPPGLELGEMS
jgi:hypothetical protein